MLPESTFSLLENLSNAKSPSGFEDETLAVARHFLGDRFHVEEDSLRNLYIYRAVHSGQKPVLMLDAHGDEVGFMIHSITPFGTLRFVGLGGWSLGTLPGSKVLVRNADGAWVPGVIAAKPPHFLSKEERAKNQMAEISQLVIDIGARSEEEAVRDFHIRIGEPAVADVHYARDTEHDLCFGKAFDCRIGCTALLSVLEALGDKDLPVDVVGVLSSQEEVGERGCKVAVNRVEPDIAIVFEGCPADDTFGEAYAMQTRLKNGPMLRFMDVSVICNPRFQRAALDLAAARGIPVQASVREGGGNNAAVIQAQLKGAPAIVMGVPVRYIHAPLGIASGADLEATIQLALAIAQNLTPEKIASY